MTTPGPRRKPGPRVLGRWVSGRWVRGCPAGAFLVATVAAFAALVSAPGCAARRGQEGPTAAAPSAADGDTWADRSGPLRLEPAPDRIDGIAGSTLVLPVVASGPLPSSGRVRAQLDDTRPLEASLWWIGIDPTRAVGGEWLTDEGEWRAVPVNGPQPLAGAMLALVVPLPVDGLGGLWVEGRRWEVRWLPPSGAVVPSAGEWGAWDPSPWHGRLSGRLGERLLAPERRSPVRGWRAELATVGLEAASETAVPSGQGDGAAVLRAFADQRRAHWQHGLARLWADDPALERELVDALTRVAEIEPGVSVPVWRDDPLALDALLDDLLRPSGTAATRARSARSFIDDAPRAAAWVIDDAGAPDAEDRPLAEIGIANLGAEEALVWARAAGAPGPEASALGPWSATRVLIDAGTGREVRVGCGRWDGVLEVRPGAMEARPPGAALGPLLHDWTLSAWLSGNASAGASPIRAATGALLYRDRGLWTLYVECARDRAAADAPAVVDASGVAGVDAAEPWDDVVRVWLGPRGAPWAIIRADSAGSLRDELGQLNGLPGLVPVDHREDRWAVHVPVPDQAIHGGVIRIGLERLGPDGARTAWPRRLLPWDTEPARAVVDLRAWSRE